MQLLAKYAQLQASQETITHKSEELLTNQETLTKTLSCK